VQHFAEVVNDSDESSSSVGGGVVGDCGGGGGGVQGGADIVFSMSGIRVVSAEQPDRKCFGEMLQGLLNGCGIGLPLLRCPRPSHPWLPSQHHQTPLPLFPLSLSMLFLLPLSLFFRYFTSFFLSFFFSFFTFPRSRTSLHGFACNSRSFSFTDSSVLPPLTSPSTQTLGASASESFIFFCC